MPSTPTRREAAFVAALTLTGAVLRFWGPGRLGLNHFDEGIYAFASTWSMQPKGLASISPELIAYAPPLYPILVGVAYLFLGVSDITAILVSQVCGVLTIPAVAWVARRTFGPGAGAAGAALCAISGPHVAFSRMALVDPTFLLCWVLALGLGGRFLERPGALRAVPFGLMVGLAQNAKYNGYLAGGIVALTALLALILSGAGGRRDAIKAIGYGLIAAAVAGLVYWPWYRFVEAQPGGYGALVRHHRDYLSGPAEWTSHWRLQMAQAASLGGEMAWGIAWGLAAWVAACLGWLWSRRAPGGSRALREGRFPLVALAGAVVMGASASAPWWVALASMPWLLVDDRPAARLVGVGWLAMTILGPFYHPYARLWLPVHAANWLALAGTIAWLLGPSGEVAAAPGADPWPQPPARLAVLIVALAASLQQDRLATPRVRPLAILAPTDGLRRDVLAVADRITSTPGRDVGRVRVLGRPSLAFYLAQEIDPPVAREASFAALDNDRRPDDVLVLDTGLVPDWKGRGAWGWLRERWVPLDEKSTIPHRLAPTTLLDVRPGASTDPSEDHDDQLMIGVPARR